MNISRKFERQGPLWVPRYERENPRKRYDKYRKRFGAAFAIVSGQTAATASSTSVALPNNPTAGNLVVCGVMCNSSTTGVTLQDGAGTPNVYTATPKSPFRVVGVGTLAIFWIKAPATANKTLTATPTGAGSGVAAMGAQEMSFTGNLAFDTDVTGHPTNIGNTLNGVGITPLAAAELLYGICSTDNGAITSPFNGATQGGWTGATTDAGSNYWGEYILASAASQTFCNWTDNFSGDDCAVLIAAFGTGTHFQLESGTGNLSTEASGDFELEVGP